MFKRKGVLSLAAIAIALAFGPVVAQAGVILSFDLSGLSSDFDFSSKEFTTGTDTLTAGNMTRFVSPVGITSLNGLGGSGSSYAMTMDVGVPTGPSGGAGVGSTAVATGSLIITDVNGEWISADISGLWTKNTVGSSFGGDLTNVLNSNMFTSGTFEGPSGSPISTDFSDFGPEPFSGTFVTVTTQDWFADSSGFLDSITGLNAQIIPAPGAVTLGLLGLGTIAWLRKRTG